MKDVFVSLFIYIVKLHGIISNSKPNQASQHVKGHYHLEDFFSLNSKTITFVCNECHPVQNRHQFSVGKSYIDDSFQLCLVKLLLVAVAFEVWVN